MEEMVTISKKYFDQLEDDSLFLDALRINGVDNWEWYGEAVEAYENMLEEENNE